MKRRLFFFILLTSLCLALTVAACTGEGGKDPDDEDNTAEQPFFDYGNLNYSPFYSNPDDPSEKGYILYDTLDVSGVAFTQKAKSSAYFILKSGGTELTRIDRGAGGVYTPYELTTLGDITVEVYLPVDGKTLKGEFVIKVAAGGFPTAVEYEFLDAESNQPVAELTGGMTIRVDAKVYSGNELLTADSDLYTSGWQSIFVDNKPVYSGGSLNGIRTAEITLPNLENDAEIHCNYQYKIARKELPIVKSRTATVMNNLDAYVFDWGFSTENGEAELSPAFSILGKVTAYLQFKNGDRQDINFAYSSQSKDGDLVPFIRYSGEENYAPYEGVAAKDAASLYDSVSGDLHTITRYISNGVSYRFNPDAESAEIYFARRYTVKEGLISNVRYRKPDGSDLTIHFTKDAPESIDVGSIKGKELKRLTSNPWESITTFNDRAMVDGKTTAKVYVTNTKTHSYNSTSNQFFFPEITIAGGTYFKDYYVRFDNRQVLFANNKEFFSRTAGEAIIEIVSCIDPEINFVLTVTFLNPVEKTTLKYGRDNNFVYLKFDPRPYCTVEEEFYNYDVVTRELRESEEILVHDGKGDTYRDYSYFTANTKKYCATNNFSDNYRLELFENGTPKATSNIIEFYVAPDYYVEINGVKYRLCEVPSIRSRHTDYFTMYAALIELSDSAEPVINVYTKDGDNYIRAGEEIRVFHAYDGNRYVEYRGFIADGSVRAVDLCVIKPAIAS